MSRNTNTAAREIITDADTDDPFGSRTMTCSANAHNAASSSSGPTAVRSPLHARTPASVTVAVKAATHHALRARE